MPCQDPLVVFPGNAQGRHIRESGPKGCLVVTIGSDRSCETVFHRLDQVRWERGRVEPTELDAESDLLGRVAETLDGLLAAEPDPDRLLAVRVVLAGTTRPARPAHADPERYVHEVRSLAIERGGDRLWMEKIEFQTPAPRRDGRRRPDRGAAGRRSTTSAPIPAHCERSSTTWPS